MSSKLKIVLAIFLLYFVSVFIRFQILQHRIDNCGSLPFSNESAQHLICTKIITETGSLPVMDNKIQHPEGINIRKRNFVFMEYFYGYLYRFLNLAKTDVGAGLAPALICFIRHIVPLLFSLSIIAIFILAYSISENQIAALISSAYYGVMLPSVIETTGEIFLKQTFALPLIFLNLSLLFFIPKQPRYKTRLSLSILAGLLLYIAVISWDLTQLYLGILFGSAVFLIICGKSSLNYLEFVFISFLFMVFAGFTNPRLMEIKFLYSHAMLFGYSTVAIAFVMKIKRLNRLKALLLLFGVFIFLEIISSFVLKNQFSTYSHITSLFFYKLRFLGVKPTNPALLPFDVNFMWLPADISPSFVEIVVFFSSTLLIGITAFILFCKEYRRGNSVKEDILLISLTLLFLIFYLLFARMRVFLIFFLCCSISLIYKYIPKSKAINLVTALLLVFLPFEYMKTTHICKRVGFIKHPSSLMSVCEWIEENTHEDSPIATNFSIAGFIRLYADRPVLIHAKVESDDIRAKIKDFMYSMFSRNETDLWRFCRDRDTDYLVYTMGTYITSGVYSWRYITGNLKFDEAVTAFKLEFKPEELKKFKLKYKNRYYRVYKIFTEEEIESEENIRKAIDKFLARSPKL
ncbi:hypothetical protein KAI19_01030 [bacterium]|nr:hypothetical protein [bacterium]